MWKLFLVGLEQKSYNTQEEAVKDFKKIPMNFGNYYLEGPDGETINAWDV